MATAIRDDNPVVYLHHYLLTLEHGEVPDGEYLVPFGQACVRRKGGDVTIVATGWMVDRALGAAERLASEGVDAEVIDPRTLAPLDMQTILESVDKTGRLVLVDQATRHASAASVIAGEVAEHGFSSLKAPIVQVTALDATIPYSEPLEAWVMPNEDKIVAAVQQVLGSAPGTAATPPMAAGRWSALPSPELDATIHARATAELLLDRYGVVTRGSVMAEQILGGFGLMYKVLARLEEAGRCRRGDFIEHLGAAQFAVPATVDRLRSYSEDTQLAKPEPMALALAATDPANPYGAALPWPALNEEAGTGHRPGRKAGALVVMVDGALVLYVERGGKTLLAFSDDTAVLSAAGAALVGVVTRGAVDKLIMEKVNGHGILDTPVAAALAAAGAYSTPKGLRIRA